MKKRSVTNLHIFGGDGNILSMQLNEIIKYFERPSKYTHSFYSNYIDKFILHRNRHF